MKTLFLVFLNFKLSWIALWSLGIPKFNWIRNPIIKIVEYIFTIEDSPISIIFMKKKGRWCEQIMHSKQIYCFYSFRFSIFNIMRSYTSKFIFFFTTTYVCIHMFTWSKEIIFRDRATYCRKKSIKLNLILIINRVIYWKIKSLIFLILIFFLLDALLFSSLTLILSFNPINLLRAESIKLTFQHSYLGDEI